MSSLRENIKKSLDDNLKKRDDIATATLRLILAAIKDSDIENRTKKKGGHYFRSADPFTSSKYGKAKKRKCRHLFKSWKNRS